MLVNIFCQQARLVPWLPSVIFCVLAVSAGCLVLILPETLGRPLPQTIAEVREIIMEALHNFCKERQQQSV